MDRCVDGGTELSSVTRVSVHPCPAHTAMCPGHPGGSKVSVLWRRVVSAVLSRQVDASYWMPAPSFQPTMLSGPTPTMPGCGLASGIRGRSVLRPLGHTPLTSATFKPGMEPMRHQREGNMKTSDPSTVYFEAQPPTAVSMTVATSRGPAPGFCEQTLISTPTFSLSILCRRHCEIPRLFFLLLEPILRMLQAQPT